MIGRTQSGTQRIDGIDWTTAATQRMLQRQFMITDFQRDERIARVFMLEQTCLEVDGVCVVESQQKTQVTDARSAEA